MLAWTKTLKWRSEDQPQEGRGVREDVQLCGWKSALKGNPKGGTGMKRLPADDGRIQSLESVRNAVEAP
jgi:hypothetical protein